MNRPEADRVDVCIVGSANLDIVVHTERIPSPGETVLGTTLTEHAGGKGLNQAVASARSGARTAFVGALGNDDPGRRLNQVLTDDHIETHVMTSDLPTGRALITVDDGAENTIVVISGANGEVSAADVPAATVTLAQLEVPIEAVIDAFSRARSQGGITVLNPAPGTALPAELLANSTYIIPNEHELALIGGSSAALAAGCAAVIVTRGGAGVEIITIDGTMQVAPFQVEPVDTTGAGDAFCGSFAARIAAGYSVSDAVTWAAAAGALATTKPGAVPSQPTATAIEALVAAQQR